VLYYLLPFGIAMVLFVGMEWLWHHKRVASIEVLVSGIRRLLPAFISLAALRQEPCCSFPAKPQP